MDLNGQGAPDDMVAKEGIGEAVEHALYHHHCYQNEKVTVVLDTNAVI
jgi:hypothetical protein